MIFQGQIRFMKRLLRVRRSRIISMLVFITFITFINILLLSILDLYESHKTLLSAKLNQISIDFAELRGLFEVGETYSFDRWADAIFRRKIIDHQDDSGVRMAQYAIDGPGNKRNVIDLPPFLASGGENPQFVPFEPRLTLGIILNELNAHVSAGASSKDFKLESFHWADWTDLSLLDKKILSVQNSKAECDSLGLHTFETNSVPGDIAQDFRNYCFNDADVMSFLARNAKNPGMGPYIQKIRESAYKSGLHVFKSPARTSSRVRKVAATSYLHDFMPAPMAVHLILPKSNQKRTSVHIEVSQDVSRRNRLINTPMATGVAMRGESIDLREELTKLVKHADVSESEELAYRKVLYHEMFEENSEAIEKQLSKKEDLPLHEQRYLESLQCSLNRSAPSKYFYEALLVKNEREWFHGGHHDWRFFKGLRINTDLHLPILHGLISAWLRFTNANGITTWIAHGSLLGWYWNGLSFPWDADYDVQVPISDLHRLARDFNQTIIVDFGADNSEEVRQGRYFLDCGTWISHREPENGLNNIDARFIDMDSGLYIDITALAVSAVISPPRYNKILPPELQREKMLIPSEEVLKNAHGKLIEFLRQTELSRNKAGKLYNCRNRHFSSLEEISPLRLTMMEGVLAYVPNNFTALLQNEYGEKGIGSKQFHMFAFLPRLRLWVNDRSISRYTRGKSIQRTHVELGRDARTASRIVDKLSFYTLSDQDYLELMAAERDLLFEYLASKEVTAHHRKEMELLLQGNTTEHLFFTEGKFTPEFKELRPDVSNFLAERDQKEFADKLAQYMQMHKAHKAGEEFEDPDTPRDKSFPQMFRSPFQAPPTFIDDRQQRPEVAVPKERTEKA